jgi:hypothetical protein
MKFAVTETRELQLQTSILIFSVIFTCSNLVLFQCNVLFLKLISMYLSVQIYLQVFDQNHLVENSRKYTKHSGENANFQLNNFGTTHVDILKRISALKRTLKIGHYIEIKLDYYT